MNIITRPINLRNTLELKYEILVVYKNILVHADLPYYFDTLSKPWWRYFGELYGFNYNRIHRSYELHITNGLKKNIKLFMPFLINSYSKKIKFTNLWKKRSFLFKNTYINKINWINSKYFKKIDLFNFNIYQANKDVLYNNFKSNLDHYSINSYGLHSVGNENFFSSYNYNWHDIYNYNSSFYKQNGISPSNNIIGVNNYYLWSSFFINLFDTNVILYPQYYLNYYNNIYIKKINFLIKPYIINIIKNFNNYNYKLFNNLYNNYFLIIKNNLKIIIRKMYNVIFEKINFIITKNKNISKNLILLQNNIRNRTIFKKIVFLKNKKIYKKIYKKLKYFINFKKQNSEKFIKYFKGLWTSYYFYFLKNKNNNLFIKKKKYNFKYINNVNNLLFKKEYILNIKRILNYGKLFLRVPTNIIKNRIGFTKINTIMSYKTLFKSSLFILYNKEIYNRVTNNIKKIFYILILSIKINFGINLSLYYNVNNFFFYVKNIFYKYLNYYFFFKKNNNLNIYKKKIKNYYFNVIFNLIKKTLNNISKKKIKYIINIKLKYINFCYKNINLSLLKKK